MGKLGVYCLKTLNKLSIYPLGNTPSAPSDTRADGLSRRPQALDDPDRDDPDDLEEWIDTNAGFFIEINSPPSPYDPAPPLSLPTES